MLRWTFAPGAIFASSVFASVFTALFVTWVSLSQPWLGISFEVQNGAVVATDISTRAPIPADAAAAIKGQVFKGISGQDLGFQSVSQQDLTEEPDAIGDPAQTVAFFDAQTNLHERLNSGQVTLFFGATDAQTQFITVTPDVSRPLNSLPLAFWIQIGVGLFGLVIGAWVVTMRRRDLAAWLVLLSGVGLALAAWAAAVYSTRELALSGIVFPIASRLNGTGTFTFGIGMLTLFLIYPRPLVAKYVVWLPAIIIGLAIGWIEFVDWPRNIGQIGNVVAITMLALLIAIAAQVIANRKDPAARAMLGWFGLCVAVGAGGFVLTSIVPQLFGQMPVLAQSTAFLFFLLIYAGIALGVVRYRLFDLADWSFRVLFYGLGVVVLLLLDAALIYGLALGRAPAFGISLAFVGLLYLPLRGRLDEWFRRTQTLPESTLFHRVTQIAHAIDPSEKEALLTKFWSDIFNPLSIDVVLSDPAHQTDMDDTGSSITLAPVMGLPALRLNWPHQGARLFSRRDLARARGINALIDSSLQQNQTYLEAVTVERSRINRDMHDNIGVLLLSALHTKEPERKNLLIRQTLTDLREIISRPDQADRPLRDLIADLRAEIISHLEAAEITVAWQVQNMPDSIVTPAFVHTVRAVLREGVNNVIRHAQAQNVQIICAVDHDMLTIVIEDDGTGFDTTNLSSGNGIGNLSGRVAQLGGQFELTSQGAGAKLRVCLPLAASLQRAAE